MKEVGRNEAQLVQRRAGHRDLDGAGGGVADGGLVSPARGEQRDLCKWKAKFGGLEVSEAQRLRHLEDENAKLKKRLAYQRSSSAPRAERPLAAAAPAVVPHDTAAGTSCG